MNQIKKIASHILLCALVIFYISTQFLPIRGAKSFPDPIGHVLLITILLLSFAIGIYCYFILVLNKKIKEPFGSRIFCILVGLTCICLGNYAFSEKIRFAELPGVDAEAHVTNVERSFERLKRRTYYVTYEYSDKSGDHYVGRDELGSMDVSRKTPIGGPINIYYLQMDHAISRVVQSTKYLHFIFKWLLTSIGMGFMIGLPFYNEWYRKKRNQEIV